MANKVFNTRLQQKRATQAQWEATSGFIPLAGEIIIYEPDGNYNYPRMKVGDGVHTIAALPFVTTTVNGKIGAINLTAQDVGADEEGSAAAALEVAREEIEAIPQADWNENDETSKAYVANRTHWVEEELIEILPETTFTIDSSDGGTGEGWYITSPLTNSLIEGNTYKVVRNNIEYEVVAKVFTETADDGTTTNLIYIGNGTVWGGTDTGEPFIFGEAPIDWQTNGIYALLMSLDGITNFSFSVEGNGEIVHPLDPKFFGDLRGQKQILITIAEDETITSDVSFDEAYALDVGELQTAIIVNSLKKYGSTLTGSNATYSVKNVTKGIDYSGQQFIEITISQHVDLIDLQYLSPQDIRITWKQVDVDGVLYSLFSRPFIIQYLPQTRNQINENQNYYLIHPQGNTQWRAFSEEQIKENLFERSNWNADIETKGYIKNRTHYTEAEEIIVYSLSGDQFNLSLDGSINYIENIDIKPENNLVEGETYVVRLNDKEYASVAQSIEFLGETYISLGNPGHIFPSLANDVNCPFGFIMVKNKDSANLLNNQFYALLTINSIYMGVPLASNTFYVGIPQGYVKKIDQKYVSNSNWNSKIDEVGYIENRTHYEEINYTSIFYGSVTTNLDRYVAFGQFNTSFDIIEGRQYRIITDGVEKIYTAYADEDGTIGIGDANIAADSNSFWIYNDYDGITTLCSSVEGYYAFDISLVETTIKKLDPKYLDYATDEEIYAMMIEEEALPVIQTEDGFVLCSAENEIMFI